ncbi:MAG: TerD family protein [Pseudomonadota bacterium]|nr:TerD family protein [Pseudomonadota bacterium]
MAINLTKGSSINLNKQTPSLQRVRVGLGWEMATTTPAIDLDVSAFVCRLNAQNEPKLLSEQHLVFFNNLKTPNGSVVHSGDNRTGAAEGDDETLQVDLTRLELDIREISFVITIHDAAARGHKFGQLREAYIKLYNADSGELLCEYDLDAEFGSETALQVGSIIKNASGEFEFHAIGAGYNLDLGAFLQGYL